MPNNRRAGVLQIQINGDVYDAAGDFTYNLGFAKREGLVGPSGVQGYSEMPQIPFIEGTVRDSRDLNEEQLLTVKDATITLLHANGKTILLRDAWQANEGNFATNEGTIEVRFEGMSAEAIQP
jgi:hypothetical protein